MNKPIRIQLSRRKGWRMPPLTVNVARPGRWGNPYRAGLPSPATLAGGAEPKVAAAHSKPIVELPSGGDAPAAAHTKRLKTALSYASKTINERFKGQMLTKGYKSIEDIPVEKADTLHAWIEKAIDREAAA